MGLIYRLMVDEDLPGVMVVEEAGYSHPWSRQIFLDCLGAGYHCWVLQVGADLVGHGVMSLTAGECEILNLCVHPDWRGGRPGPRPVGRPRGLARPGGAGAALLRGGRSNRAAIHLYQSEGFCETGLRRGYYPAAQGREDAILMAMPLLP